MTQPTPAEQLLNLADRAERGPLTGDEATRLREGVTHHCARADEAERRLTNLRSSYKTVLGMFSSAADRAIKNGKRAEKAEATIATFAAIFEGFGNLLATSSRDWGAYRVDAWLWAVTLGWDCEETKHDDTCTHGVLEEMAAAFGWDGAAVAKARRYRATVRAALDEHQEQPRTPPVHIGNRANAEDCPACEGTNPPYPFICPGPAKES